MRLHALSIYSAVCLTISTTAMPTGPPPCHDESVMPDKTLPYLSPPLQKSYTEKPYQPYAASMAPPPALKVENPKLQQKSYPPALAPKPYLEKSTPERPYTTPPLHKEKPKPEDSFFSPAPALKPYQEKPKTEEKPYAAPLFPPRSKEEVPKSDKSEERTCTLGLVQEPFPEKPKLAPKEDKYKRQEKAYSPLPPPPYPPSPQPYSKSVAKPKPWAKTKIEEKPKPDMKPYPQKQPYLEEKIKSEKQKPQDHFTKASDKPTPERLDSPGLSSQADSLIGSNSIGIPTDGHCLLNGYSTNGDECPKELPYARRGRRGISTISRWSMADR